MVEDEESDFDDEIDDEEQTEVEDEQEQPTYYKVRIDGEEVEVTRGTPKRIFTSARLHAQNSRAVATTENH